MCNPALAFSVQCVKSGEALAVPATPLPMALCSQEFSKLGKRNFSIYGCCLAAQQPSIPKLLATSKQKKKTYSNVYYQWNDDIPCNKSTCCFAHRCWYCTGAH